MKNISRPVLVLGGGGHAKVLIDCLQYYHCSILGITDPDHRKHGTELMRIKILGNDEEVLNYAPGDIFLINGLGSVDRSSKRKEIFQYFKSRGYSFLNVIHPSSVISPAAALGEGVQVMAGAVIQPGCCLGDNTVINTKASIDHDCHVGKNVHIAPGATLSGDVKVGDGVHVGSGATVIQGIQIGEESIVGAGSLVLDNVPPNATALGVPAKVVVK